MLFTPLVKVPSGNSLIDIPGYSKYKEKLQHKKVLLTSLFLFPLKSHVSCISGCPGQQLFVSSPFSYYMHQLPDNKYM